MATICDLSTPLITHIFRYVDCMLYSTTPVEGLAAAQMRFCEVSAAGGLGESGLRLLDSLFMRVSCSRCVVICSFTSARDCCRALCAQKAWRSALEDDRLWKTFCREEYSLRSPLAFKRQQLPTYRSVAGTIHLIVADCL